MQDMQSVNEQANEIKTQLFTPEGIYRLVPHAEYTKPKASTYSTNTNTIGGSSGGTSNCTPVRISFTKYCNEYNHLNRLSHSLTDGLNVQPSSTSNNETNVINHSNNSHTPTNGNSTFFISNHESNNSTIQNGISDTISERICFNIGKEIFIFVFNGLQPADLSKLMDRRTYKTTTPTCHDFCSIIDQRVSQLLIGFSAGQIQLIDMYRADVTKFYNQDRIIDKTKATCVRWLPRSKSSFMVSYASGQMYLYKEDLTCGNTVPNYQQFKSGEGYTIYTCKTKSSRNPIFRWSIGEGAINEFSFSQCGQYLATVSQDGFLRVFHYDRMELLGRMRSYFGGLLCLDWSADSKMVVTGGEDDLITVWSVTEKRVIARGQGHKSWINAVTFDPYMCGVTVDCTNSPDDYSETDVDNRSEHTSRSNDFANNTIHYRIGSVGQDTQICLWDLTEDLIEQSSLCTSHTTRTSRTSLSNNSGPGDLSSTLNVNNKQSNGVLCGTVPSNTTSNHHPFFNSLMKVSKLDHKRGTFSLSSRSFLDKSASNNHHHHKSNTHHRNSNSKNSVVDVNTVCTSPTNVVNISSDPVKLLGTSLCPKLYEVPMMEPIVCKKIAFERLTALAFRKDYLIVANQDGKISIFARPTKSNNRKMSSPNASIASEMNEIVCDDSGTAIV